MYRKKRLIALLTALIMLFTSPAYVLAVDSTTTDETATRVQEIESLRETNSETYLLSDGTYECVVYAYDKYYADEDDTLRRIDNTITKFDSTANLATGVSATNTVYKNTANAFDVYFADGNVREVNIQYKGKGITFSPLNAANELSNHISTENGVLAIGKVENCATLSDLTATGNNTVTYADAFTNTDLVYVLENNALKEYIILNSSSSPNEFSFMLTLDGVTMQTAEGSAYFTAADGSTVFALDTLFAVDADGVITEDLNYSFAPVGNTDKVIVTVTLDEDYLSSAERAFPVVIDPTIMISSSSTADACVCSVYPNTNYKMATQLRTGYDSDYGIRRSYIKFNIPDTIPGGSVTSATLDIEKLSGVAPTMYAYMCMASWSSGTITWNNKPSGYNFGNYQSSLSTIFRPGSTWYTMDVTTIVQKWVNSINPNYGFILQDINESNPDHWTTLYSSDAPSPHKPELHINYSPYQYYHYYDSSISASRVNQISNAVSAVNTAYSRQFHIQFSTKGTPQYTSALTSGSEKNIITISNTLYSYSRDVNEIKVFWTDYPDGTYCLHESGSCNASYAFNGLAVVYKHRPVIHIANLLSSNGSAEYYEACMGLTLIHETAHTFGMEDNFGNTIFHNSDSGMCVMKAFSDDENSSTFYKEVKRGDVYAFCDNCANALYNLIAP